MPVKIKPLKPGKLYKLEFDQVFTLSSEIYNTVNVFIRAGSVLLFYERIELVHGKHYEYVFYYNKQFVYIDGFSYRNYLFTKLV